MSFLKPPVFVKTILLSCAFFASMFFNSCKQLTSFDPNVDGVRVAASNTFSAPADVKATQGRKQMISLEWTPVSGAKYYDVYCAESATAEFKKIGGTDKNSFDDRVGAGRTLYYRVCSTKSDGTQSDFSATVKGTSLAQPVISGGDVVGDYSVTISWFMENSRCINGDDNYEKSLKFDVCYKKIGSSDDWEKKTIDASSATIDFFNSYKYTLSGLANASNYQFRVDSYTEKDSNEFSDVVNKATMISYNPVAPEFEVSEGTSAKKISLDITIPPMVMVHTVTKNSNGEEKDEEFPLYFEIYRKLENKPDYPDSPIKKLYCNGSDSAPDYSNKLEEIYKPGNVIKWIDEDSADFDGGEKYEYMIRSVVDIDYGKVICPEGTELAQKKGLPSESKVGWKSVPPVFEINRSKFENNGLTLSKDKTKICSVLFCFNAEWNDLGKADEYKFAIKQTRKPLTAGSYDGGVDKWLDNNGDNFFETLEEIASLEIKFGSEKGLSENEKGLYTYTLYIVPKSAAFVEGEWDDVLDFKEADEVRVTDEVELPKAEFEVKGGYNSKVKLIISNFEPDVRYVIVRTKIDGETQADEEKSFVLNDKISDEDVSSETCVYYDESVTDNCRYSYVLKSTASNGVSKDSEPQFAETLGTPNVLFETSKLEYNSFVISFENVLAAESYTVQLGASNDFGGGDTFEITKSGDGWDSNSPSTAKVEFAANKFTIKINKPYGYDNPKLAGKLANASVKAFSDVDEATGSDNVRVLGPALINAEGGSGTDKMIVMTWDKVEGANGYLIYRTAYKDADALQIESSDMLYYSATDDDITLVADGQIQQIQNGSIRITKSGEKYTLQDTDTPAPDNPSEFQKNQSRISWGRPFGYIVLPVKDKADFTFKDGTKELADSAKVDYTKNGGTLAEAQGNTYGYGMNTAASKSDSTENVAVKWEKPNAQTELVPTLYRRVAGTDGDFTKVKKAENLSATDTPTGDYRYEAFEYVVKYDKTEGDNTISVPASLLAKLAATKEERYDYSDGRTEPQNKGYVFAVKLSAEIDKDNKYYEAIYCDWDYSKRGIGPDKLTLSMYNNNIKDDWVDVLAANGEDAFSVIDGVSDIMIKTDKQEGFSIAPMGIATGINGTTDGMLKVLRDYKHYYKLKAERANSPNVTYEAGNDKDVFAYREITDEELLKATMLIVAAIEQDSDSQSHSMGGDFSLDGYSGSFSGSGSIGSQLTWTITNYVHNWTNTPGGESMPSFLTLSDTGGDRGRKSGAYFVSLYAGGNNGTADLNNKIPLTIDSEVYGAATIEFAADKDHFEANVIRSEELSSFSKTGLEGCRYWFPMDWASSFNLLGIANGHYGYFGEDPNYGWWPPSN